MRHTRSLDVVPIDLDIDKTLHRLEREPKQRDLHEVFEIREEVEAGGGAIPNRALKD